ncbi:MULTISPECIES: hypothetical protein [Burkholderia cepacia complex]|uniref:Uncharacterized protein n=1 Tax=Burkholderia vietnamiensis TaxID=60552 RepID=A0AAW7T4V1_BURVI|nr:MULTISPECIES: hypothetical protein [Burkholderia cepacia complex]MBU9639586.1 hypothetical protein [Burkholderia multivorans]MDN7798342.1 hypothetical protein [Burkholderia vietnamiensis]PRF00121.1 hypothetical protein C6Q07_26800 [Burkholderia multivorans]
MATARKSTKATATKVEFAVINVGHAFIKGKGPNDKPKKDSLWGLLQAGDLVVKFFGRKGGAMRFKVADSMDEAQALYAHKLAGTDAKKLKHQDLSAEQQKGLLGDAWPESLFTAYKKALQAGKIDQRNASKAAPEAPQAPASVPATTEAAPWPWPKSPVAA